MIDDATYIELLSFLEDELTVEEQERFVARLKDSTELAEKLVRAAGDQVELFQWASSERTTDVLSGCSQRSSPFPKSRHLFSVVFAVAASLDDDRSRFELVDVHERQRCLIGG